MVKYKKGDIIEVDFNPTLGREQAGYGPALVISNESFNSRTGMLIILPISQSDNGYPLHVALDQELETKGFVLCEHLKSMDAKTRKIKQVEVVTKDFMNKISKYIHAIL